MVTDLNIVSAGVADVTLSVSCPVCGGDVQVRIFPSVSLPLVQPRGLHDVSG